jgi:hypothetical protein
VKRRSRWRGCKDCCLAEARLERGVLFWVQGFILQFLFVLRGLIRWSSTSARAQ